MSDPLEQMAAKLRSLKSAMEETVANEPSPIRAGAPERAYDAAHAQAALERMNKFGEKQPKSGLALVLIERNDQGAITALNISLSNVLPEEALTAFVLAQRQIVEMFEI